MSADRVVLEGMTFYGHDGDLPVAGSSFRRL